MVFIMAATQLSVFGLLYLIAVFIFLYQGKGLLIIKKFERVCVCGVRMCVVEAMCITAYFVIN